MTTRKNTTIPSRYQQRIRALDLIEVTELVPRSKIPEYRQAARVLRMQTTRRRNHA